MYFFDICFEFSFNYCINVMLISVVKMTRVHISFLSPSSQSLLLLAYLIRNGSERVVTSAREHIYDLRSLENYHFVGQY